MANKVIHGIFDDDDVLLKGVKEIRERGISIDEVYTPFPVHGLDHALGLARTRISIAAFFYGIMGTMLASLMMYYMMIADWPQNIGGKPSFSFLQNMPSFVPIMFEVTVLCASHLMAITFLIRCGLFPGAKAQNPDPRTTDDKFLVEINSDGNDEAVRQALMDAGAVEVNEQELA